MGARQATGGVGDAEIAVCCARSAWRRLFAPAIFSERPCGPPRARQASWISSWPSVLSLRFRQES